MTDQDHSAKAQEPEPTAHPYNNPNLSPIEFLEAAMNCDTLSIALRVKAAKALTSIHTKAPQPPITIHIKDPYSHEYLARFPWLKEFAAEDREQINTILQSFRVRRPETRHPSSKKRDAVYTETTSHPSFLHPFNSTLHTPPSLWRARTASQTKAQAATYKTPETLSSVPLIGRFGHEKGMCACNESHE
jgi:hypothetical protein